MVFFICITPELSIIKKQINYKSNFVQTHIIMYHIACSRVI